MKGHECYHCKQWVAEGEAHDCWTTTYQLEPKQKSAKKTAKKTTTKR